MSWRNVSSIYPSISLQKALPVYSHCLRITLASPTSLVLAYPPRDPKVEEWFSASPNSTQQTTENRCHAFLYALLSTTLCRLREICDEEVVAQKLKSQPKSRLATLASEFRDRMADGRTFEAHGAYRTKFYDDVYAQALKVMLPSFLGI